MLPGLQVAVQHAPAVGVVDRVADVEEPPQQLLERQGPLRRGSRPACLVLVKLLDGRLEVVAADEPHGVEGAAVVVGAQAVDRHDAGVFEPAGDLGLDDEAGPLVLVGGVVVLDPLQRHDAVELAVAGDVDLAEGAAVVEADDLEAALGVGPLGLHVPVEGRRPVGLVRRRLGADRQQAALEVEVGDLLEVVADLGDDAQHGQAALGVAAVLLEVLLDQRFEDGVPRRARGAAVEQDLAQGLGLVGDPGVEGGQRASRSMKLFCRASRPKSRLWAALTGRRGRGWRVLAEERRIDGRAVVGEPHEVLRRGRLLARGAAELALDAHELLEQAGAPLARPRPGSPRCGAGRAPFPLSLEAVGRLVDPGLLTTARLTHANTPSESGHIAPLGQDTL